MLATKDFIIKRTATGYSVYRIGGEKSFCLRTRLKKKQAVDYINWFIKYINLPRLTREERNPFSYRFNNRVITRLEKVTEQVRRGNGIKNRNKRRAKNTKRKL